MYFSCDQSSRKMSETHDRTYTVDLERIAVPAIHHDVYISQNEFPSARMSMRGNTLQFDTME